MKIIFSTDAIKYPLTGIGMYSLRLIKHIKQSNKISKIQYFNNLRIKDSLPKYSQKSTSKKLLSICVKRYITLIESYCFLYPKIQKFALRNYQDFIYHGPNYYLPKKIPRMVTTFHDISIFTNPQFHPTERVRYMRKAMYSSIRDASRIITVSEFSKRELIKHLNYPENKIDVTELACSGAFYPRTESEVTLFVSKFGLMYKSYTLFVGTIEPRKNITSLLDAYENLPKKLRIRYPLVLCGYKGWGTEKEHQRFHKGSIEGWIKYLGYLSMVDLPLLFSAARLFVFPSIYEGFGLPVLEAMSSGIPVLCSNTSSLPEIVRNAAITFNPLDTDALTNIIINRLQDEEWQKKAVEIGLLNAKRFSWSRCAQETIKSYLKV